MGTDCIVYHSSRAFIYKDTRGDHQPSETATISRCKLHNFSSNLLNLTCDVTIVDDSLKLEANRTAFSKFDQEHISRVSSAAVSQEPTQRYDGRWSAEEQRVSYVSQRAKIAFRKLPFVVAGGGSAYCSYISC